VERTGAVREREEALDHRGRNFQARLFRLVLHPEEGDVAQALVRIAPADIGVHSGEPHLLQPLPGEPGGPVRRRDRARLVPLIPEQRVKGIALVVDREGVAGAANLVR
jgi:hypothetical protein